MSKLEVTLAPWTPRILSILRLVTALLFFEHGLQKLLGFPPSERPMPNPLPPMLLASGGLEFVGGALLAIGLFTRPVAFILSGMMAVAYFMAHAPRGFFPILNGGELAIVYCFVFFYFFFAGGGAWSADALIASRKRYA
jgi:putative oxidoreductase